MISIRKASDRGQTQTHWLQSWHTFSFGEYYDTSHMGFAQLRVINEDTVQPGQGFGTHSHRNMEIVTVVISGALEHKDSLGTGSVIKPGEVQRMTAGSGVSHSEFNHSNTDLVHFLQIWILPRSTELQPSYEQKTISMQLDDWVLIGSANGRNGSVTIHQDVDLWRAKISKGFEIHFPLTLNHHAWCQVISGSLTLNGILLSAGDGAAISKETDLKLIASGEADCLLFDLYE